MKKRGQITIFIIIGIILVLSIAIGIYFYQQRVTAPIKRIVAVPEEVQQIYDYVATCTEQIAKDGLILQGAQGGYINIPPIIDKNPNAFIPADPAGIAKTPLWYYEGEDRTPTLEFMQRELAVHVKQNLPACTGNFEAFKERFTITPKSDILPVITYTEEEVIVEVKWQLEVTVQNRLMQLNEFIVSFPLKLKAMHELARQTMETENRQGWFENLTIDLMTANEKIPFSGMEISCATKKWHIQDIKKQLQKILYYNLPLIRVANTNYPPPIASLRTYASLKADAKDIRKDLEANREPDWPENPPADVFEMNRMMLDVGAKRTDLKVAFTYLPNWPLLVNAQPSSGGILSTANVKGARKYLRFLCINQWHFTYDVIYPVKMQVKDDTAFNGEGYVFQMGFPVIINDNEEARTFFGIKRFTIPDQGTDFCTNFGTQSIEVRAKGFVEGGLVAEELDEANITYTCMNQECLLGKTYSDGTGVIRLRSYLPEGCANPRITAQKEGYLSASKYATTDNVELMLTRLKKLPYTISVHPYDSINKRWLGDVYNRLPKTTHATVAISLRNQSFDQYKSYPANATQFQADGTTDISDVSDVAKDEIEFVYDDARYDIDILLFKGNTVVGGYHAENITITYEQIAQAEQVVFNVFEWRPLPDTGEKQAQMFLFLYETKHENLEPTFT
ncbi:MAG: hypothetical protein QW165_01970 [Candidatus Woesearchaeota archaeon]